MKLPKIPKDQLPDDLKDQIEGDEAEFEPLGETEDAMKHVRQKKSESEMRRTLGEREKLNKIFKERKKLSRRDFIRKIKNNQKYHRSNLFHIKNIHEGQKGSEENYQAKEEG